MKYTLAYGKEQRAVDLPSKRVVGVLSPRSPKPVSDADAAVRRSLSRPLSSPSLTRLANGKKRALILTVDNTRPNPVPLLRPMVDILEKEGLSTTILIATGRHRIMTRKEVRSHLGPDLLKRCRAICHDPFDETSMVDRGETSRGTKIRVHRALFDHDLVLGCGFIEPSYLCGWSGGRKLLMPGVAHHESIDHNHFFLTDPDTRIGRLRGNPVSEDAFEFAADLPLHFICYGVVGPDDQLVSVVSGDPILAHEQGCLRSEKIYRLRAKKADIVVSSAGGWPYDFDLVQGKKAIIPAAEAVNRNGVILLCAACPDGLGAEPTFLEWLRCKTPAEVVQDVLDRKQFNLGAHGANILARPIVEKNAQVLLYTNKKVARTLEGTYVRAVSRWDEAWKLAGLLAQKDASVLFIQKARRIILY